MSLRQTVSFAFCSCSKVSGQSVWIVAMELHPISVQAGLSLLPPLHDRARTNASDIEKTYESKRVRLISSLPFNLLDDDRTASTRSSQVAQARFRPLLSELCIQGIPFEFPKRDDVTGALRT